MPEIVDSNAVNQPSPKPTNTRSLFPLSYPFMQTHQFGRLHPHFVMDVVPDDKNVSFRSIGETRSYTLGAPLMQDIYVKKDYFQVDKRAILPVGFPLIFTNPTIGQDVDASTVGTSVANFPYYPSVALTELIGTVINDEDSRSIPDDERFTAILYFLFLGEYFYSRGSLNAQLGANLASLFSYEDDEGVHYSFDKFEDRVLSLIERRLSASVYFDVVFDNSSSSIRVFGDEVNEDNVIYTAGPFVSFSKAIEMMRDSMSFHVVSVGSGFDLQELFDLFIDGSFNLSRPEYPLDLIRLFAYQIVCAHYFTNDKVDYVYSADLYRELIGYYVRRNTQNSVDTYQLNGLRYRYDWCSAHYFVSMMNGLTNYFANYDPQNSQFYMVETYYGPYLRSIFGFNRSLRYMDYFTGSRTRPLAVGGTDIQVNQNLVSVIDVTQKIQTQRFLNAVNRTRRTLSEYVKGIFGVDTPAPDFHDPYWLAHTEDIVYTDETENTATDQLTKNNSVTAIFRNQSNKYGFNIDVDYPGVVIGITYYDIQRVYKDYIERPLFHVDRYDMFNPFMQYIGDQPVYLSEFDPRAGYALYFGYQLRHMEFKQRIPMCAGGFAEYLAGYAFVGDDLSGTYLNYDLQNEHVSPDFIRSWPFELDPFYLSLANRSQAGYFHFIVKNVNECSASRPMAFAPSIL